MFRKVLSIIAFLVLLLTFACNSNSDTTPQPTNKPGLTIQDFQFLEVGISLDDIERQVGSPNRNVGSGMIVVVYDLVDSSMVILGFGSDENSLIAADHQLPDGTVEPIIGNSDQEEISR